MTETIKLIESNSKTIGIVEVPEGAIRFNVHEGLLRWTTPLFDKCAQVENDQIVLLPIEHEWQILGKSLELSEVQMKEICNGGYCSTNGMVLFEDYLHEDNTFDAVQESYLSLLQANGIVDRNHIEKPDWIKYEVEGISIDGVEISDTHEGYDIDLSQWKVAQKQVRSYLILSKK